MIFVNNRWYRQTFKGAKQTGTKRRNNDVHSYIIPKFNVVKNSQFSFYFLPHSPSFPTFHNCCWNGKLSTNLFCLMCFHLKKKKKKKISFLPIKTFMKHHFYITAYTPRHFSSENTHLFYCLQNVIIPMTLQYWKTRHLIYCRSSIDNS